MTPAERLAKWRAQGVYTMPSEALLAAYTPERVAALLLAAKGTRLLTTSREFGTNFFLETPDAGGRPDEV